MTETFKPDFIPQKKIDDFGDTPVTIVPRRLDHVPAAREMGEGEMSVSVVSGVFKLHIKLNGAVRTVTLT